LISRLNTQTGILTKQQVFDVSKIAHRLWQKHPPWWTSLLDDNIHIYSTGPNAISCTTGTLKFMQSNPLSNTVNKNSQVIKSIN